MPILRNPFRRAPPAVVQVQSQALHSHSTDSVNSNSTTTTVTREILDSPPQSKSPHGPSLLNLSTSSEDLNGAIPKKIPSAISISRNSLDDGNAGTYKLSVVNDSGVYLPPSPIETKSFWRRDNTKSNSPKDRLSLDEPFMISRESFDSYRRSFDISARSPVMDPSRTSLDSRQSPRTSIESRVLFNKLPPTPPPEHTHQDEGFEEINLDDEKPVAATKKRGIFARFSSSSSGADNVVSSAGATNTQSTSVSSTFKFISMPALRKEPIAEVIPESRELKKIEVSKREEVA